MACFIFSSDSDRGKFLLCIHFFDAIASPSTYPCQSVGQSVSGLVIVSDLKIAIVSPSLFKAAVQLEMYWKPPCIINQNY